MRHFKWWCHVWGGAAQYVTSAFVRVNIIFSFPPELATVANRAINVLVKAADNLALDIPEGKRPPSTMVSQHIWAMSHGIVELYARGEPGARSPFPPEDLLEAGIGIYLRGLGVLAKDH